MIRKLINTILIGSFLIATSCVDEYWPELVDYENIMVIDGLLTDGNDTAVIYLSRSASLDYIVNIPVKNAEVIVYCNDGSESILQERIPGEYLLVDPTFIREVGKSYQLLVKLEDGKTYESPFCKLPAPNPIDSVYAEIKYIPGNNEYYQKQGLEFYIDNHSPNHDTANYLWRMWQTYKYKASLTIDYLWEGHFIEVNTGDSLRYCYRTDKVEDIVTYSTQYLSGTNLVKYPILFTSTDTKTLSIRCSLLVEQLVISSNDFEFWDAIRQQEQNQDELYTHNPFQIRGNMKNVDDGKEVVLGNFTVAGSTKKRIYVNRPAKLDFYYSECEPDFESIQFISIYGPSDWPIFVTEIPGVGLALGSSDMCFDCRLEGGSLTPPAFWTDY